MKRRRSVAEDARAAVAARGEYVVAISDERIAPPGDPDRNLMHLRESLLSHVSLCPEQIHGMPVDCADLESACSRYSQTLEEMAGAPPMKTFRALSPLKELQRRFGFEPDNVVQAVMQQLCQSR